MTAINTNPNDPTSTNYVVGGSIDNKSINDLNDITMEFNRQRDTDIQFVDSKLQFLKAFTDFLEGSPPEERQGYNLLLKILIENGGG